MPLGVFFDVLFMMLFLVLGLPPQGTSRERDEQLFLRTGGNHRKSGILVKSDYCYNFVNPVA